MKAGPRIIDFHAHVGEGMHRGLSSEELLRQMDRWGVDRTVLCPVDEHIAVRNREGNDLVAAAVRAHPDRFGGFAVANPWYGGEAVDELERALDAGLVGAKFHPVLQGFMICDPIVDPLIRVLERRGLPAYFHTGSANLALPFQLAELALRFPRVRFVMGHLGFSDFWYDMVPAMERAPNLWGETSHAIPDFVARALTAFPRERVVFGSDLPESNYAVEIGKFDLLRLDEGDLASIFHHTAEGLLEASP